ncbi:Nucleoporin nup84 [Coemansia sp. RSA 1287]|nr:Nucleoporin nup84 [Coemansia sp. RSA 1287]
MTELVAEFALVVEGRELGGDVSRGASAARVYKQLTKQRSANATSGVLFGAEGAQQRHDGKWWQSESDTWDLLARLYEQRQQRRDVAMDDNMDASTDDDATLSDFVRAQDLLERDGQLAEYVEVRRWLEDTAREFQPVETRKGYLFYTRRSIRTQDTADSNAMSDTTQLVTDIDPDASSRQRRDIAIEDHEYTTSLLRTLFEYVRRGRMSDAMALCVESDEPWRAASMKGGLFWRDPQLEDAEATPSTGARVDDELFPPISIRTSPTTVLLNSLPADFVQPEWITESTPLFREYMHILSLCDALAFYASWAETVCRQPTDKLQSFEHKQRTIDATVRMEQLLRRVLDVDWLGTHVQDGEDCTELQKLRLLYVPEVVFRLHGVLYETRDFVPQNLARSLELAQMVAGDGLGIYRELAQKSPMHPNGRLVAFMALMRKSAFELLRVQESASDNRVAPV